MRAFAWMLPVHQADGLVKQQPISQHSLRARGYKVSHNVNAGRVLGITSCLHVYPWGKLNCSGASSEEIWLLLLCSSPKAIQVQKEMELSGQLKTQKCRPSKATSMIAFSRRWWWWRPQNSCNGNVLALLESLTSPGSFALLPSTPAVVAPQGKAPEPHLTQVQSHCCLFLLQKCGASESV